MLGLNTEKKKMEIKYWILYIIVSLFFSFLLKFLLFPTRRGRRPYKLPPGPATLPILTNFLLLRQSPLELESVLRSFMAKYGPIITLNIGLSPAIFIADRSIAHEALVQNGAVFADRPPLLAIDKIASSASPHNISSAPYGPTWRVLRRNLAAGILHPLRVQAYSRARKWVLDILVTRLVHSEPEACVLVVEHLQFGMFCLLAFMCFGDEVKEDQILEIQQVQRELLVNLQRFVVINFCPKLMKILLRKRWKAYLQIKSKQQKVLIPFINAREKAKQERARKLEREREEKEEFVASYVDTLLDLHLIDENRKLKNEEIVHLCSEFLNAGTDTTATTLQWIMANLVKYPQIQHKLFQEIKGVMTSNPREKDVKEEDLGKLPYLKAVVLEGLRRHPPGHFMLPHAVKEDTTLENYFIPKNGTVNFLAVEIGWDPEVWEDPMAFKPERFMSGDGEAAATTTTTFDITGSKEIKMMPFGAGRRICPAASLAMLHLEYFVANLVWKFEWKAMEGDEIDLSEKMEYTIVMNKPLKAHIHPRF